MDRAVAYLRVSTQRQERSGLGIDAQRAAIVRFADAEGLAIIGEYVEAETGKGTDALDRRPSSPQRSLQPELPKAVSWSRSSTASRATSPLYSV
jgi:hypothetical protein